MVSFPPPAQAGKLDWLLPTWNATRHKHARPAPSIHPNSEDEETIFLHPGEPVFDRFRDAIRDRFAQDALRGSIFIDPTVQQAYYFHRYRSPWNV